MLTTFAKNKQVLKDCIADYILHGYKVNILGNRISIQREVCKGWKNYERKPCLCVCVNDPLSVIGSALQDDANIMSNQ